MGIRLHHLQHQLRQLPAGAVLRLFQSAVQADRELLIVEDGVADDSEGIRVQPKGDLPGEVCDVVCFQIRRRIGSRSAVGNLGEPPHSLLNLYCPGDIEVRKACPQSVLIRIEIYVVRFQISVEDSILVELENCLGNIEKHGARLLYGEPADLSAVYQTPQKRLIGQAHRREHHESDIGGMAGIFAGLPDGTLNLRNRGVRLERQHAGHPAALHGIVKLDLPQEVFRCGHRISPVDACVGKVCDLAGVVRGIPVENPFQTVRFLGDIIDRGKSSESQQTVAAVSADAGTAGDMDVAVIVAVVVADGQHFLVL